MDYSKFEDMYYEIGKVLEITSSWIVKDLELKTKEEIHIVTQMIAHIILFLDIKYENKSRVEEVMKKLISENKIKHINNCKSKKDIIDFLENISKNYYSLYELETI